MSTDPRRVEAAHFGGQQAPRQTIHEWAERDREEHKDDPRCADLNGFRDDIHCIDAERCGFWAYCLREES